MKTTDTSKKSISILIDRTKAILIGYNAYYEDGQVVFYKEYSEIKPSLNGVNLINVKQVGEPIKKAKPTK